ncbi:ribosomal protein S4 [Alkaliphilus metalliredigens QYMF]|uniref:Small ribosomal subunit protein uS4A n=1 Tax=Alkaliphilus metalliredigens (strain QYMF) TaxID=293826 RepID=RS4A_ALKMQ|nr:30S ribosomal protein S4 [Alkaliphilus metalliredigens]A6TWF4.1 RecName: Full=Small ribosomal subunit protein uS4A; AltName: Full=30S ribosomal protein S4 1 [Alkaliphilus metalliredigens QYMF]ABR50522.1 ribosomal protein S4 [Alkaliphilus metalliredigens QYMF]
MARYTDAVCRLCRREGLKLYLKGERCYTDKCAITKRNFAPGQHGTSRKKLSNYGVQLREKQKAKRFYGVLESQFRKYFDMADKQAGNTGENLLRILETRLDNLVYRLGLASSRAEARQLVVHGHFTVNGGKVDIPSYLVKAGDAVAVSEKSTNSPKFKELKENFKGTVPTWLTVDSEKLEGKVAAMPSREDIDLPISENLIVELYSK